MRVLPLIILLLVSTDGTQHEAQLHPPQSAGESSDAAAKAPRLFEEKKTMSDPAYQMNLDDDVQSIWQGDTAGEEEAELLPQILSEGEDMMEIFDDMSDTRYSSDFISFSDDQLKYGSGYDEVGPGLVFTTNLAFTAEEQQEGADTEARGRRHLLLQRKKRRMLKGKEHHRIERNKATTDASGMEAVEKAMNGPNMRTGDVKIEAINSLVARSTRGKSGRIAETRQSNISSESGSGGSGSDEISSGLTFDTAATYQPTRPPSGVWEETDFKMTTTTEATATLLPFTTTTMPPDNDLSLEEIQQVIDDTANPDVGGDVCVCSPREYTIKLALNQLCDVDDLQTNGGIGGTLCVINVHDPDEDVEDGDVLSGQRRQLVSVNNRELSHHQKHHKNGQHEKDTTILRLNHVSKHQLHKLQIVDVQFIEFALDTNLTVLNQDNTYTNVSLSNGDLVTFPSISKELNTISGALDDEQMSKYIPGGVQVNIRGLLEVEHEEEDAENGTTTIIERKIISQHLTWSYTNDCDVLPVEDGDRIGWSTFERLQPASRKYCPVAPLTMAPSLEPTPEPMTPEPTHEPITAAPTVKISQGDTKTAKAHHESKTKSSKVKSGKALTSQIQLHGKNGKMLSSGKSSKSKKEKKQEKHYLDADHMAKVYKHSPHPKSSKMSKLFSMLDVDVSVSSESSGSSKTSKILLSKVIQMETQSAKSSKKMSSKSSSPSSQHEMDIIDAKAKKVSSQGKASKVVPKTYQ